MNRWLISVLSLTLMVLGLTPALAQDDTWPRTVPLENGIVTIYAPQLDKMTGDTIHYRAALAYREKAGAEPIFGAGWFESAVDIDKVKRIVHPVDFKVTETRFPAGTDDITAALGAGLASQSSRWNLDFSLDKLETELQTAAAEQNAVENLNTSPPEIIYRDHPALLITMDGQPVLREIENSQYQAVINTPYPLIYNNKHYYLNAAKDVWYRADKATGPYSFENKPPSDIAAMVKDEDAETAPETPAERVTAANAPEIVVSTVPAELIVTEGPAAFVPLVDDLLVLDNSENDVFMHVSSQQFFIVLAGRWYHAASLNGPWSYQAADDLPKAFADIPQDSDQADSRVYVAGTEEAREAVLDAEVPQTAAIQRGVADVEVVYDGQPVYEPVAGTDMVYIRNTGSTVLRSGGLFYLVEDGVWYVSTRANGPWQVSDHRPEQVDTILPTSPVYNSRYVYVYDSTPEVVYVGYTPGYTGSYVYHHTLFYGTGWYYRPWVSPYYYYPRISTWGFNAAYNPWSGWGFGLSWGWGPFSTGYYPGGYWHNSHYWHHNHYSNNWGPRGYRSRPSYHGYRSDRYARNNHRSDYNGRNDRGHDEGRGRDGRRSGHERNDNLYRDRSQRANVAQTNDRRTRDSERRYESTRQANNQAARGTRQQRDDGVKKGERNQAAPVSTSDIRKKAAVRDSEKRTQDSERRYDSTRQANNVAARGTRQQRDDGVKKGERNQAAPVSTSDIRKKATVRDSEKRTQDSERRYDSTRQANNQAVRGARQQRDDGVKKGERNQAAPVSTSDIRKKAAVRDSDEGETRQTTQPVSGSSPIKINGSSAYNQGRGRADSTGYTSERREQTSNKTRQRSPRADTNTSQEQNVVRSDPRPKREQNSVRTQPQPSRSVTSNRRAQPAAAPSPQYSGRNVSVPAQSAPRAQANTSGPTKGTAKSSRQSSGKSDRRSSKANSKRSENERSKD